MDLVEIYMLDFDIILGMDCLHSSFSTIGCRTRVVRLNFPNEPVIKCKGVSYIPRVCIIACQKA